jgi:hypothetical protein
MEDHATARHRRRLIMPFRFRSLFRSGSNTGHLAFLDAENCVFSRAWHDRSNTDDILEAIRKIKAHSAELAKKAQEGLVDAETLIQKTQERMQA